MKVKMLSLDRKTALSLISCLLFGFVLGLGFLTVPLYTLTLTDSPIVLALVVGAFPLASLLVSITSGALTDYFGSRPVIATGFACMAGGCVIFALSFTYPVLIVGQVLFALGGISLYTAVLASLMTLAPVDGQYALQGLGSGMIRIGTVLGPLAGGLLVRVAGFESAFLAGTAAALGGSVLALGVPSRVPRKDDTVSVVAHLVGYHLRAWQLLQRNLAIRWANGLHAVGTLAWGAVGGSYYLSFLTESGFSPTDAGLLRSCHLLVAMLVQLSAGQVTRRLNAVSLASASVVLGGLILGMTPFLQGFSMLLVAGSVAGMSWIYLPLLLAFSAERTRAGERSMSVALFNVTWGLVNPAGLLVLGTVVERTSLACTFVMTGVFTVVCSIALLMWAKRKLLSTPSSAGGKGPHSAWRAWGGRR